MWGSSFLILSSLTLALPPPALAAIITNPPLPTVPPSPVAVVLPPPIDCSTCTILRREISDLRTQLAAAQRRISRSEAAVRDELKDELLVITESRNESEASYLQCRETWQAEQADNQRLRKENSVLQQQLG